MHTTEIYRILFLTAGRDLNLVMILLLMEFLKTDYGMFSMISRWETVLKYAQTHMELQENNRCIKNK